jgi:hypothetical protein
MKKSLKVYVVCIMGEDGAHWRRRVVLAKDVNEAIVKVTPELVKLEELEPKNSSQHFYVGSCELLHTIDIK